MRDASSWVGCEPDHGEAAFGGELHREGVGVAARVVDLLDARVHDHLYTHQARLVGAVDGSARDLHAVVGGLDDGVLFGVKRALAALAAVHYADQASHLIAMRHTGWATVVTGREDAFVAYDHGPDGEARAGRASSDLVRYAHEILDPRRTNRLQGLVQVRGVRCRVPIGFHRPCVRQHRGLGR